MTLINRVDSAINIIKRNVSISEKVCIYFSGGKDSCVLKHLLQNNLQGYNLDFWYCSTGLESNILSSFIKGNHPEVKWKIPVKNVYELILEKGYAPTIRNKFCCKEIKRFLKQRLADEYNTLVLGKRQDERYLLKNRVVESIVKDNEKIIINPLYDWTTNDVWEYIEQNNIPICETYSIYGASSGCFVCLAMGTSESKYQKILAHPQETQKLKQIITKCYDKNIGLQNTYKDAEEYWYCILNNLNK